jgi:Zn-dependent M28 family amino/carboxypeptidase
VLLALGCGGDDSRRGLEAITPGGIEAHLRFLSSDLLEGRAPGTRGAELAAAYIATQFELAGLRPAVGDSSYYQPIPLVVRRPEARLRFRAPGGAELSPSYGRDFVGWSTDTLEVSEVETELVFVGYGISAPERGWDDYEGADVTGKMLLVLVNDPGQKVPGRFRGDTLTYYGRWTYKLEEAVRRGAAGVILIHTPETAGYGWNVVRSSASGARISLEPGPGYRGLGVVAWLRWEVAEQVVSMGSLDFAALLELANSETFRPIATGVVVRATVRNEAYSFTDFNVAGLLPGSDPQRSREVIVYSSHYDHLGIGEPAGSDSIYNGAYDNASGTALLLSLVEAFARLPRRPARSILFLAVTAQEPGMLGSKYYVSHPLFPLERTVAAVNIDGANVWGLTDDIVVMGVPGSGLEPVVARAAKAERLRLESDRAPERGYLYRSDHFSFLRARVPAVHIGHGLDFIGRMPGWGEQLLERFTAERYHQPSDEFRDDFDFSGAVQQARVAFRVGLGLANAPERPAWPGGVAGAWLPAADSLN